MEFERAEPRVDNLTVRIRASERKQVEAAAEAAGVTVSEFVRAAVRRTSQEILTTEVLGHVR